MEEKVIKAKPGMVFLILFIALYLLAAALLLMGVRAVEDGRSWGISLIVPSVIWFLVGFVPFFGLKILRPQEALVLTLFGNYIGTLKGGGFFFVNPFSSPINPAADTRLGQSGDIEVERKRKRMDLSTMNTQQREKPDRKVSLKVMTLNNARQKVNDALGNPVEVGVAVIWQVVDTAKAVFNVDNYKEFLSLQCDAAVRNIVKNYPYDIVPNIDTTGDGQFDDGSLRGSTNMVTERIRQEIQAKADLAGIEVLEARITYLAYATEIASVMLQRQQASAIIDARTMIVEGAVSMVEMALNKLTENHIVELDNDRKATMVSNLLVILCGNRDAQPVVNSGTLQ